MASVDEELLLLVGTLVLIVIMELIRIGRDIDLVIHDDDLREIEYDSGSYIDLIPLGEGQISRGYSMGALQTIHFLIDWAIICTLMTIFANYRSALWGFGPDTSLTPGALILSFLFIWMFLPLLLIPKFERVVAAGIHPKSFDIHTYSILIISGTSILLIELIDPSQESVNLSSLSFWTSGIIFTILTLALMAFYANNRERFYSMLDQEIREASETE